MITKRNIEVKFAELFTDIYIIEGFIRDKKPNEAIFLRTKVLKERLTALAREIHGEEKFEKIPKSNLGKWKEQYRETYREAFKPVDKKQPIKHFTSVENGFLYYLCNSYIEPKNRKLTIHRSEVNCKNCKRILKR